MKLVLQIQFLFLNKLLHFRMALDLRNNCEESIELSPVPHIQLPQLLASYITMAYFSQLINQY